MHFLAAGESQLHYAWEKTQVTSLYKPALCLLGNCRWKVLTHLRFSLILLLFIFLNVFLWFRQDPWGYFIKIDIPVFYFYHLKIVLLFIKKNVSSCIKEICCVWFALKSSLQLYFLLQIQILVIKARSRMME